MLFRSVCIIFSYDSLSICTKKHRIHRKIISDHTGNHVKPVEVKKEETVAQPVSEPNSHMLIGDIYEAMRVGTEFATETLSHYGGF